MKWAIIPVLLIIAGCGNSDPSRQALREVRPSRVAIAEPQLKDVEYVLNALGSVESINDPTLSAETSGQVQRIDVKEGDSVDAGQILATLDSTLHAIETAKAEAELRRANVLLDNQGKEVQRLRRLDESQSVSRDRLEDEQATMEMLKAQRDVARKQWEQAVYLESKTQVKAPLTGLIARRHISSGDYVVSGQPLFELVSVERLRVRVAFPEHEVAKIKVGKKVRITTPAALDQAAIGMVTAINPQIKTHNRAAEIIVEFDNPGNWLPGASVDAVLVVERHEQALTVPLLALSTRSSRTVVFVVEGDSVRAAEVRTGWREQNWIEIVDGLQPGEKIVVEGAAMLSAGSPIEVESSLSDRPEALHP